MGMLQVRRAAARLGALALLAAGLSLPIAAAGAPAGATTPTAEEAAAEGAISAGNQFTCAVTRDGGIRCWGQNNVGQLGDGTTTSSATPVAVVGLPEAVVAVDASDGGSSASGTFACARSESGVVRCWGRNDLGQLGNGATTNSSTAVEVTGLGSGTLAVSAGANHACAITAAGAVRCWGFNSTGQLGNGSTTASSVPVAVAGLTSGVRAVAAGGNHTCAITESGGVVCWGQNGNGQLGTGSTTNSTTPVAVSGLSSGARRLVASSGGTCALTDTDVRCWGQNNLGQLGNGTVAASSTPVAVVGLPGDITSLAAGSAHLCARSADGRAWCWGQAADGKLGNGTVTDGTTPTLVAAPSGSVQAISAGSSHSCALTGGGSVRCWGDNTYGQLASALVEPVPAPAAVPAWTSGADQVEAGSFHSCAKTTAGAAVCWGDNFYGELGIGSKQRRLEPTVVPGFASGVLEVGAGGGFSCALTTAGAVSCWGNNSVGQLGNGTLTPATSPVPVTGLGSGVAHLAVGSGHSCATLTDGTVRCWGQGTSGQLGNGGTINALTPVVAQGLTNVAEVAPGGSHTCARTTAGAAWCWGANTSLQLLNGIFGGSPKVPTLTPYTSGVTDITAGAAFTCMVLTGAVRCTGANSFGQAGNGTTSSATSLVSVTGLTSGMASVNASWNHACAVTTAGATSCWGANADGQLGNGTFAASSSVPVAVTGQTAGIASVSAGTNHTCTVDASGGIACWGQNERGQLGSSSPTWLPALVSGGGPYGPLLQEPPDARDASIEAVRSQDTTFDLEAPDPNGDEVTFAFTPPTKGDLDCTASGACTYRSIPGASGVDSFTFIASDGHGASGSATVAITLVNTAPVADDQQLEIPRRVPTEVALSGVDANADPLTAAIETGPANGTLDCTGPSCTYTSLPGATGTDSFTFTVDDGFGGTDAATVDIALTNAEPTAEPQALSAPVRAATPIALTGSDPNGDALTYAVTTPPTKGSVTCDPAGTCSYRSSAGASGSDAFTFQVDDGNGGTASAVVEISLSNSAPVADPQTVDAPRRVATAIALTGTDPNEDPLTYAVATGPTKGSIYCDDDACTYTSDPGAIGTDAFTFTVTDPGGETDAATIAIALTNSAPVATGETVRITRGTTKTFALDATDPNGDALTYQVTTPPSAGALACTGSSCSYTADGSVGTETLAFTATDPDGAASAPATVTIDVGAPKVAVLDAQVLEPDVGGTGGGYVPVTLTAPMSTDVVVSYATADGTATGATNAGGDYHRWGSPSAPRTITIKAGQVRTAIPVVVYPDARDEGDETFTLQLAAATATGQAVALGASAAQVTIVDNHANGGAPLLFVGDAEATEGDDATRPGSGSFTVQLSRPLAAQTTLTLVYAPGTAAEGTQASGADWRMPHTRQLVLPAGTNVLKTLDLAIWADTLVEGDETLQLAVLPTEGAPLVQRKADATLTILDDD